MFMHLNYIYDTGAKLNNCTLLYHPFHKTLPRSSAFVNLISVRFYETGCMKNAHFIFILIHTDIHTYPQTYKTI